MTPQVRRVVRDVPAWRWGMCWGCGEGLEWSLFRPNPLSLMLRTENALLDCNNWALRICFFFCSIYVEIRMPWYVENRMFFFVWYPTLKKKSCYVEWKNQHFKLF